MKKNYVIIAAFCVIVIIAIISIKNLVPDTYNQTIISQTPNTQNNTSQSSHSLDSITEILEQAHAISKDSPTRKDALHALEKSIHETKENYEKVLSLFREEIVRYEQMSHDFDQQLQKGVHKDDLAKTDRELQAQAQKVLALKRESNDAYVSMMKQIDESVPALLEKHF